jgi:hypothetical protein
MSTNKQQYRFGAITTLIIAIVFILVMFLASDQYQLRFTDFVANLTGYFAALVVIPTIVTSILALALSKILRLKLHQTIFLALLAVIAAIGHVSYTIMSEMFF